MHVYRVYDYTEQLACVRQLPKFIAEHPRVCSACRRSYITDRIVTFFCMCCCLLR
jgi:hypothetical protein